MWLILDVGVCLFTLISLVEVDWGEREGVIMGLGWFCRMQNFPNAVMLVQCCFILKAWLILAYLLVGVFTIGILHWVGSVILHWFCNLCCSFGSHILKDLCSLDFEICSNCGFWLFYAFLIYNNISSTCRLPVHSVLLCSSAWMCVCLCVCMCVCLSRSLKQ